MKKNIGYLLQHPANASRLAELLPQLLMAQDVVELPGLLTPPEV